MHADTQYNVAASSAPISLKSINVLIVVGSQPVRCLAELIDKLSHGALQCGTASLLEKASVFANRSHAGGGLESCKVSGLEDSLAVQVGVLEDWQMNILRCPGAYESYPALATSHRQQAWSFRVVESQCSLSWDRDGASGGPCLACRRWDNKGGRGHRW